MLKGRLSKVFKHFVSMYEPSNQDVIKGNFKKNHANHFAAT